MAVAHLPALELLARAVGFAALQNDPGCRFSVAAGMSAMAAHGPPAIQASPVLHSLMGRFLQVGWHRRARRPGCCVCSSDSWRCAVKLLPEGSVFVCQQTRTPCRTPV